MTTFADGLFQYGGVPVPVGFTGKAFFVDPVNGSDGNVGTKVSQAFSTLYRAHAACTAGKNDTVYLIGDGGTTGTARLSKALAQSVDSTASVGTLVWSKNATHLVGISSRTMNAQRARISPVTTETITTFGSGTMVSVTAQGCYFTNFSAFQGFATGGASEIAWADTGGRNTYDNVQLMGGGDAASTGASVATMRSLLVSGTTGENTFRNCTIGLDTTPRSTGSFEFEIAGGSPRNVFDNCIIQTNAGAVGCTWMKIGADGIDRYVLFRNCTFINPTLGGVGASAMTTGFSVNAASGGAILLQNCLVAGATKTDTGNLNTLTNIANAASLGGAAVATSA